jgi:hypothetical protein
MTKGESPQFALPSMATIFAAESGTCLTQTTIFKVDLLSRTVVLSKMNFYRLLNNSTNDISRLIIQ